jgi:Cu/Ag efflux pump CusA
MINRLIELSLKNRFLVVALFIGLAGWGWWAVKATPVGQPSDRLHRLARAQPAGG